MRLLNCINDAKKNGKKLIVAFLDFENYFNSIGLECLFEILEKFGMAKEDVRVLRQYYEHSYRWCRRAERRRRLRIRLQRGLRHPGIPFAHTWRSGRERADQMAGKRRWRIQT